MANQIRLFHIHISKMTSKFFFLNTNKIKTLNFIKPEVCRCSHSIIVNYYYTYIFGKVAESSCLKCTVLLMFSHNIYSLATVFRKYINVIEYSHLQVVSKLKIQEFSYHALWIYNHAHELSGAKSINNMH